MKTQSGVPLCGIILLSAARPTSPASDQTKGGGRSGVQRTPRFGAREQKIRSDEDTALSKLSPKIQRNCQEISWVDEEARRDGPLLNHNTKRHSPETSRLYIYHTEKRSGRATPEIFLFFCLSLAGGSFTHVVRVHVELLTPWGFLLIAWRNT